MNAIASIATVATGPSASRDGDDAGGDVHLAEHPAAEDVAVGVDVARPRHDPQDRLAARVTSSSSSSRRGRPRRHGRSGCERKTSPISPVPTSTVRPTPAMVAITMWTGTGSPKLFR